MKATIHITAETFDGRKVFTAYLGPRTAPSTTTLLRLVKKAHQEGGLPWVTTEGLEVDALQDVDPDTITIGPEYKGREIPETAARLFAEYADFDALVLECSLAGLPLPPGTVSPGDALLAVVQAVLDKGWSIEFNYGNAVVYFRYKGDDKNTSKMWGDYGYCCHNREPKALACAALAGWLCSKEFPSILDDEGVVKKDLVTRARRRALSRFKMKDPKGYAALHPRRP